MPSAFDSKSPSELPRTLAPNNSAPRLLLALSSKPGRLARCFLNGEPTVPSVPKSDGSDDLATLAEGASKIPGPASVASSSGAPEMGLPDMLPRFTGEAGWFIGSAEC